MKKMALMTKFVLKAFFFFTLCFFLFRVIAAPPFANPFLTMFNVETLEKSAENAEGNAKKRFRALINLIKKIQNEPALKQLKAINQFFNLFTYNEKKNLQGEEDYWKSPNEFIIDGEGNCEDFAVAKYFTAVSLGIPTETLRIAYVKSLTYNQAHMVLTYYETPTSDPLVLDNNTDEILPASKRPDLVPVYSFNADKLWLAKQSHQEEELGNSTDLAQWRKLLERMQKGK
jgi:predicted transglutaminase-like cysteine proteinase